MQFSYFNNLKKMFLILNFLYPHMRSFTQEIRSNISPKISFFMSVLFFLTHFINKVRNYILFGAIVFCKKRIKNKNEKVSLQIILKNISSFFIDFYKFP